jgi:light-regulated signal transduction histidine kinase (bacteriophytochrome)
MQHSTDHSPDHNSVALPTAGHSLSSTDPDLAVCDQEPLAFCGQIQDEGALLVCAAQDGAITHCSDNLQRYFELPGDLAALELQALFRDDTDYFERRRQRVFGDHHFVVRGVVSNRGIEGDLMLSEHNGNRLLEFEAQLPAPPAPGQPPPVQVREGALPSEVPMEALLGQIHALTRYPKIMVYRFLPEGSGEVVAELSDGSLDNYLGLRFPASDIPRNARELYVNNPFRMIFDTRSANVPVRSVRCDGEPLDLSTSTLRSVSPMHIEYLGNMGVRSSCSFSIRVMGKLWGLIALHATEPTRVDIHSRLRVFELIDRRLAPALMNAHIGSGHAHFNRSASLVEQGVQALASVLQGDDGGIPAGLLLQLVAADGLLLLRDEQVLFNELGLAPAEIGELRALAAQQVVHSHFSTDGVSRFMEQSPAFRQQVSGVLYQRIASVRPKHVLEMFWLRKEEATSVDWAGQPQKLRREVDGEVRISPRRSFEKWTEQRLGQARPWSNADEMLVSKLAVGVLGVLRSSG